MTETTTAPHRSFNEYGLLLERSNNHGTSYVVARVVKREPEGKHPLGCSSAGETEYDRGTPPHMIGNHLDGLCLCGFISESDGAYIGFSPEYRVAAICARWVRQWAILERLMLTVVRSSYEERR